MALTPTIESSQATVRALADPDGEQRVSQVTARAVINFPTEEVQATQATVRNVAVRGVDIEASQVVVRALVVGRPIDKQARAWKFVQDGHEFYVLKLGDESSLIYDRATQQWHSWNSPSLTRWRTRCGLNWRSKAYAGDDSAGLLYLVDPQLGQDESPRDAGAFLPYTRQVTGLLPLRGRARARLNGVRVTLAGGAPITGLTAITLRYSDDQGQTFKDAGTVDLQVGQFAQEILWRSQGVMRPPGRLFVFEDQGATVRIDGVDIDFTGSGE